MAIEKLSTKNLKRAIEPEHIANDINTVVELDVGTAVAYEESVAAAEHVEEVDKELSEKAKDVVTEAPEAPAVKQDNIYTKLKLEESLDDFNVKVDPKMLSDEDDEDPYLDYDMFDFVYGIVTDDWPKPKNPLGRPMRKFMHAGSDDYLKTNSNVGTSQVSTDMDGNVVIYADTAADFDDVAEVCDYYGIQHEQPKERRSANSRWKFSFKIFVPQTNGYPVMAEDYFADKGLSLSDVIEDHKVGSGKTANWGATYEKNAAKDRKQASDSVNDALVNEIFTKYVRKAGNSNDPLEGFIRDMFAEMSEKGLTYSKVKLKKSFMDEFDDDFEDDEI